MSMGMDMNKKKKFVNLSGMDMSNENLYGMTTRF
jgi:hypothetical protein